MYKMQLYFILIATVLMLFGRIFASHLNELETKLDALNTALVKYQEMNEAMNEAKDKRLKDIEAKLAQYEVMLSGNMRSDLVMMNAGAKLENKKISNADTESMAYNRHTRALSYEEDPIAFTAYLDHDLNGIGTHENLVFGHVLLNDGNGYSMHTGAFTVPVSGVYHFDFFIGERDINQMYVWLVVNNINKIDAVAESFHGTQDIQGGNAANLKLVKGDVVFLKHNNYGSHIEGSNSVRISSFSGYLLYPTEQVSIVGK